MLRWTCGLLFRHLRWRLLLRLLSTSFVPIIESVVALVAKPKTVVWPVRMLALWGFGSRPILVVTWWAFAQGIMLLTSVRAIRYLFFLVYALGFGLFRSWCSFDRSIRVFLSGHRILAWYLVTVDDKVKHGLDYIDAFFHLLLLLIFGKLFEF